MNSNDIFWLLALFMVLAYCGWVSWLAHTKPLPPEIKEQVDYDE